MKTFLKILFFFLLVTQICLAQGYWTKIGDMPENRYCHTTNEINGKIYIVGGLNTETGTIPTTALVYDRATGTWTQIPLFNNELKAFHTSCVVNSKMYIIGGWTGYNNYGKMEMFDPNTGQWISKKPMLIPSGNLACASIENKIYVVGGQDSLGGEGFKTLEVYDISTDTWTQLADMPTGRWGLRAIAFNGKMYVFGGRSLNANTVFASVEVYDPQTNTWTTKSDMPTKRYQHTTCLLDSNIFAIGGWRDSDLGPIYDKVEIYNPESDKWRTDVSLPVARALLTSIVLDGKIYVYGGSRTNHPLIGTSGIYELTYDDIFAQQPCIDKVFARENIDSVFFRTRFSNIHNHQFIPHLIYANTNNTQIDSLTLFDDGLHGDSLSNDGIYGGYILPRHTEDLFSLSISTIDNQNNAYYNTPDRCRFTTAGPLIVDSISYYNQPTYKRCPIWLFLLNKGKTLPLSNVSMKIICNDPWVKSIVDPNVNFPSIQPGAIVQANQYSFIYYDSTCPGYVDLKFEIMSDGWIYWKDSMKVSFPPDGVDEEIFLPLAFKLEQNFPNPFNSSSVIKYYIPQLSQVSLKIFNALGEELVTLVSEEKHAGTYEFTWNAANLPSGVYIYRLQAGSFVETKKMILLK